MDITTVRRCIGSWKEFRALRVSQILAVCAIGLLVGCDTDGASVPPALTDARQHGLLGAIEKVEARVYIADSHDFPSDSTDTNMPFGESAENWEPEEHDKRFRREGTVSVYDRAGRLTRMESWHGDERNVRVSEYTHKDNGRVDLFEFAPESTKKKKVLSKYYPEPYVAAFEDDNSVMHLRLDDSGEHLEERRWEKRFLRPNKLLSESTLEILEREKYGRATRTEATSDDGHFSYSEIAFYNYDQNGNPGRTFITIKSTDGETTSSETSLWIMSIKQYTYFDDIER